MKGQPRTARKRYLRWQDYDDSIAKTEQPVAGPTSNRTAQKEQLKTGEPAGHLGQESQNKVHIFLEHYLV